VRRAVPLDAYSSRFLVRELQGFRFFDGRFPAHTALPEHHHDEPSVYVVLDGSIEERFRTRRCECPAATTLFKPAGERHSNVIAGDGARALAVAVHGGRSAAIAHTVPDEIAQLRDARLIGLAREIAGEMRRHDAAAALSLEGLALELLAHLARVRLPRRSAARPPPWVHHVRELLSDAGLERPPTVNEIAAMAGRSPRHVARAFRAQFGCTMGAYLRHVRLNWAMAQLRSTELPLATIALRAGFCDQSHFSHAFRRQVGVTPRQFRARTGAAPDPDEAPPR
jgi:AraC family transcriptional regulator